MFSEEKIESFFEKCKMKRIVFLHYILRREKKLECANANKHSAKNTTHAVGF